MTLKKEFVLKHLDLKIFLNASYYCYKQAALKFSGRNISNTRTIVCTVCLSLVKTEIVVVKWSNITFPTAQVLLICGMCSISAPYLRDLCSPWALCYICMLHMCRECAAFVPYHYRGSMDPLPMSF